jgi:hypothetical protein
VTAPPRRRQKLQSTTKRLIKRLRSPRESHTLGCVRSAAPEREEEEKEEEEEEEEGGGGGEGGREADGEQA